MRKKIAPLLLVYEKHGKEAEEREEVRGCVILFAG